MARSGSYWSDAENDVIVVSYFRMLKAQLETRPYVKAKENLLVQEHTGRSRGSIERKYQNISAVLMSLSAGDFLRGYVPLGNFQRSLQDAVIRYLAAHDSIEHQMLEDAKRSVSPRSEISWNISSPPKPAFELSYKGHASQRPIKTDFVALEASRRDLGFAGELAVLDLERRTLHDRGLIDLATQVRHVSLDVGDGLGYDILSFDENGLEKYIEVKTTRKPREYPFLVSRNEVNFSREEPGRFHLYRVFDFEQPTIGLFTLAGPLEETCSMQATTFLARPRAAGSPS